MQATVASYDAETRTGSLLLDDGVELSFPEEAMHGSGLRFLRPGQRVRLETTGEGTSVEVRRVQLITLT